MEQNSKIEHNMHDIGIKTRMISNYRMTSNSAIDIEN